MGGSAQGGKMAAQYDEAAKDRNMEFESVSIAAAITLPTIINRCVCIALVQSTLNHCIHTFIPNHAYELLAQLSSDQLQTFMQTRPMFLRHLRLTASHSWYALHLRCDLHMTKIVCSQGWEKVKTAAKNVTGGNKGVTN